MGLGTIGVTPGTGALAVVEALPNGQKLPASALVVPDGTNAPPTVGTGAGQVPMPVAGAVTVAGGATAANQATEIAALGALATEAKLEAVRALLAAIEVLLPSALVGGRFAVDLPALPAGSNAIGTVTVGNPTDVSTLATQTTLAALLAKVIAAPATEAKQDTAQTALNAIKAAVEGTLATNVSDRAARLIGAITGADGSAICSTANRLPCSLGSAVTTGSAAGTAANLTAGSDYAGTPLARAPKVDSSGTQYVSCVSGAASAGGFALESGGNIATLATNLPAKGQALAAASMPVVLTAIQVAQLAQDATLTTIVGRTPALGVAAVANASPVTIGIGSMPDGGTLATTGTLLKSGAGACYQLLFKNTTGGTIFFQIHDSTTTPAGGAKPKWWSSAGVTTGSGGTSSVGHATHGAPCATGVFLVASSTDVTYTAIASTSIVWSAVIQ